MKYSSSAKRCSDERQIRLIDWNTTELLQLVKRIVGRREAFKGRSSHKTIPNEKLLQKGETFLEEVKEIIVLPEFDMKAAATEKDENEVEIEEDVVCELREYVTAISGMYRNNPFHNFDRAR